MINRLIKIVGWSALWLIFFWGFLIAGFPEEMAKDWLTDRIGKEINADVSIAELRIKWNLDVQVSDISISGSKEQSDFSVQLADLNISPKLLSLIKLTPAFDFNASSPSGGDISGLYGPSALSVSFKDISSKEISISSIPAPSGTTATGSAIFNIIKGKGMIDIEVDGIPGGKQKIKVPGGDSPGLDGKLRLTISLPRL